MAKLMQEPAVNALRRAVELSQGAPVAVACLGEAYAAAGLCDEAQRILERLNEPSKQRCVTPYFVARIYAASDKNGEALDWLEIAYRERAEFTPLLKTDPRFDDLRPNPRFQDLMRRMNFP